MDTAQRGMGLRWPTSLELIRRSLDAARAPRVARRSPAAAVYLDHLDPADARGIDDVIAAYDHQAEAIESAGGRLIVMASRALARVPPGPRLPRVYEHVLGAGGGRTGDPALAGRHVSIRRWPGYWGTADIPAAMDTCVEILAANADKVDGIKISLLDKDAEIAMRRRLPAGVRMYTGDDFNYPELIAGDDQGYSDALLGHLRLPSRPGRLRSRWVHSPRATGRATMPCFEPTVPLSPPRFFARTDTVLQDRRRLPGLAPPLERPPGPFHDGRRAGEGARSTLHLADLFRLADRAGLLTDPTGRRPG